MMRSFTATLGIAAVVCGGSLHAAELGDAAKPIDIKEWVKGTPVDLAAGKGKTTYVVEFWGTLCPPCVVSIPHLTELQKKYKDKDVVIIGVTSDPPEAVKKFVERMGDKMNYTVAIDKDGKTTENYFNAYSADGIPVAFVVDKEGRVVWHGNPRGMLEDILQETLAGQTDLARARKLVEAAHKRLLYTQLTMSGINPEAADKLEKELVQLDKELGGKMDGGKFDPDDLRNRIQYDQKLKVYQRLVMSDGDKDEISKMEQTLEKNAPADFNFKGLKEELRRVADQNKKIRGAMTALNDYFQAVGENGDPARAAELAKAVEALELLDPQILNEVAWNILTNILVKNRDAKLALKLSERAVKAGPDKNPILLRTYARALFDNGKFADAVTQQKKAIELADDEIKAELKETLNKYEAKAK